MAGAGNYAFAALFAVVVIMVGAGAAEAATDVTAPAPSPTMEAGAASMAVVPSLFVALIVSFIPFLASRFY
uniref:Uncharacterized protein n=1 Tax=Picea sitchensis TaxID=3332 RepID=A9NMP9_PICSI|nr:unknown [Picea sitchensis]